MYWPHANVAGLYLKAVIFVVQNNKITVSLTVGCVLIGGWPSDLSVSMLQKPVVVLKDKIKNKKNDTRRRSNWIIF